MHDELSQPAMSAPLRLAACAMGTRFELVLAGRDEGHLRASGEAAIDEIETLHDRYSAFARDSVVTRINAADGPVRVDAETFELLARADALRGDTGGAFDVTIGRAMGMLGHQRTPDVELASHDGGAAPLLLDHTARTARLTSPGASIDLGAIAKGFAIDAAVRMLREFDVPSALVHAGGSTIATIGVQHTGVPWTISIPDPLDRLAPLRVTLTDAACSVSTTRGDPARPQPAHLLDPRTGEAAGGAPLAAAVAASATATDAWATALCVLGSRPASAPASLASILRPQRGDGWHIDHASTLDLATISTQVVNP